MAATETKVQAFIHALEEGGWVSRIRLILLLAAIVTVYTIVILNQFKGLSNDKGMDQAQVGRQLAGGHGFTTKFLRPIAYGQFVRHLGTFPAGDIPDKAPRPAVLPISKVDVAELALEYIRKLQDELAVAKGQADPKT